MSNYTKKPGDGQIWINDKKEKDSHPDRKGDAFLECPHCQAQFEVWISGWIKKKSDGEPFLSLSMKPKEARDPHRVPQSHGGTPPRQPRQAPPANDDAYDMDVPF